MAQKTIGIIVSLFFLLPFTSYASVCYESVSFGEADANGTFEDTLTTNNGSPIWENENGFFLFHFIISATDYMVVGPTVIANNANEAPYYLAGTDPEGTYTWNNISPPYVLTSPGGDVSLVDCPGGGTGTTTATSTVNIGNIGEISFGLAIIILLLSIAFIAYIYNSITPKKPWKK